MSQQMLFVLMCICEITYFPVKWPTVRQQSIVLLLVIIDVTFNNDVRSLCHNFLARQQIYLPGWSQWNSEDVS